MNNSATIQKSRKDARGMAHYKLVFKPKPGGYKKTLAHWNNDWENGPLITFHRTSLKRCRALATAYDIHHGRIYDYNNLAEVVDTYFHEDGCWKSGE